MFPISESGDISAKVASVTFERIGDAKKLGSSLEEDKLKSEMSEIVVFPRENHCFWLPEGAHRGSKSTPNPFKIELASRNLRESHPRAQC